MAKPLLFVIAGISLAAGIYLANRADSPAAPSASVGEKSMALFKDLTFPVMSANDTLNQLTTSPRLMTSKEWQGKITVLNFWGTWCAPCVKEMPELSATYRALKTGKGGEKLVIVGIGVDSESKIREYRSKNVIDYPLVAAGFGSIDLLKRFDNAQGAMPYTLVFDQQGKLLFAITGEINFAEFTPKMRQLLAK